MENIEFERQFDGGISMDEKQIVDEVISQMRDYCSGLSKDLVSLDNAFEEYMEKDEEFRIKWADYLGIKGLNILQMSRAGDAYYMIFYYIMTFLLRATGKREIYKALLQYCIADGFISKETKFYLYYQLVAYNFLHPDVPDEEISDLMDDLYSHIYQEYKKEFTDEMSYIPREQRNENFVMVFISQVLGTGHGPTKTLLDRCYILEKYLNKKVYIVNTAEYLTQYQSLFCFAAMTGNYKEEYSQTDYLTWKDKNFAFMQCPNVMPHVSIIKEILNVVKCEKPYFILNIGGNSIVNDLCSNIVPTLTVGTVPSGRPTTLGQFRTVGRTITEDDRKWQAKHHMPEDSIIEGLFTSAFKEQTHQYTREQLGLPNNRFIAVIVGGRLDEEIDSECMKLLERLVEADIFIAFMGRFNKYVEYASNNEIFKQNTIFLGLQEDVLAVNEVCDLYINPKRVGGGTSAAEAMYKGLPVVTWNFGDVGLGAGSDFHVVDYEAMYEQVLRYAKDKEFYEEMSRKAKARAEKLTDSKSEFVRIIETMVKSQLF